MCGRGAAIVGSTLFTRAVLLARLQSLLGSNPAIFLPLSVRVPAYPQGSCWVARHPLAANIIQISHYGLTEKSWHMRCDCALCGPAFTMQVPDVMEQHYKQHTPMRYGEADTTERPALLFFAGRSTGSERNHVFHSHIMTAADENPGEIRIFQSQGVNLGEEMAKAKFCLAPPGGGFGTRGTVRLSSEWR